jgi:hypothetical protein
VAHQRKLIREAAVSALVSAGTSAGARVKESRLEPARAAELPCISVYTTDESVDPASITTAPREMKRTVQLEIVAWARATENIDDVLDGLAEEIENAVESDPTFGDTASNSILSDTAVGLKLEGDRPMGAVSLTYAVTYFTRYEAPDGTFDDLSTIDVNYNNQAQDTLKDLEL